MKAFRFLLFPFSIIYYIITSIRNFCYDRNIFSATKFKIPVIAVGNLSVGGTGKTPQIEYLIRLLKEEYNVAVLSRGYKRKTKGFLKVNNRHSANDVGDEPLQFYQKFHNDISVAVDADRTNGIKQLIHNEKPDIILLDDAFQHRKVKASTYILLTKWNDLYTDDFLLPTGNLREGKYGSKRADYIIVTKCPKNLSEKQRNRIQQKLKPTKNQRLFFSYIEYDSELKGDTNIELSALKNKEITLVTGIANPKPLVNYLKKEGIHFSHIKFPDHHQFKKKDIEKIHQNLHKNKAPKILLTTEKDYTRLKEHIPKINYISIQTKFLCSNDFFDKSIKKTIKQ